MNFIQMQDFLKESDKRFLWSLAINEDKQAIKYFEENTDLKNIIKYSISNQIEHHLYEFLKKYDLLSAIEEEHIHAIKSSVEIKAKKSMITYHKGLKVLNEFTKDKINYVSLKGFSYLEYNNTFDRPIRDIDVLIDHGDIERAVNIAMKNGFMFKNHKNFSNNMILNNSDIYDLPDLVDENNVCMEIHYKILRDSNSSTCKLSKALFEDVKTFYFHGSNIKTSSLSSCLSHLAYHATKKGNFDIGLRSIFDLKALSRFSSEEDKIKIKNISSECRFSKESELFLSIIESKDKSCGNRKTYLLKELIFSPNINIKIQEFFLKESLIQKFKHIFTLLFVNKHHIKREFQSETTFFISSYFARWARQIRQFGNYMYLLIFKKELFKRRAKLIKEFYKD